MYIAFAPEYEIENTETFNFQNNYTPVNLEKIDEKKDLSTPPKDVNNAFLTSQVEKSAFLITTNLNHSLIHLKMQ